MNAETCLEMNLVYQEVVKEKLAELEQLLQDNSKQQVKITSLYIYIYIPYEECMAHKSILL